MEFPEPFHSAKMSSWPSLMKSKAVSRYAKSAVRAFLKGVRSSRLRPNPPVYRVERSPKPSRWRGSRR